MVRAPASSTEPLAPDRGPGSEGEPTPARALAHRLVVRLQQVTLWQWALVAAIAGYTSYFTNLTLDVHHGLGTSAYDFGLYDQGVWLMSRFEAPFVTLMGRNLMGDHSSFILVFLVPIYWLFPSAGALFFTQSLAIALGAVPVFLLGKRLLGNEWMPLLLSLCYLIHPAVAWTSLRACSRNRSPATWGSLSWSRIVGAPAVRSAWRR